MLIVRYVWPFVKEMVLGKQSFRYALKKNRVKVIFFASVLLSYSINWWLVPTLWVISADLVEARKEIEQLKALPQTIVNHTSPVVLEKQLPNQEPQQIKEVPKQQQQKQEPVVKKTTTNAKQTIPDSNVNRVHDKLKAIDVL